MMIRTVWKFFDGYIEINLEKLKMGKFNKTIRRLNVQTRKNNFNCIFTASHCSFN